jgi:hypothetical protein
VISPDGLIKKQLWYSNKMTHQTTTFFSPKKSPDAIASSSGFKELSLHERNNTLWSDRHGVLCANLNFTRKRFRQAKTFNQEGRV